MTGIFGSVRLVLATRNVNKRREFEQLLGPGFIVQDVTTMRDIPEVVESGTTFAENATLKAIAVSKILLDQLVIADDSGLEVKALHGAPGVFSARYAGEAASDRDNVEKLLCELTKANARDRSARFCCIIALARNGELLTTVQGEIAGVITTSPRGGNGFGYDPIFVPDGFNETFGELTSEAKNKISHRAKATAALVQYFERL